MGARPLHEKMLEKNQIKVAMVISKAEASLGGTQKQALRLADELQSQGVSVLILTKRKRWQHGDGQVEGLNGRVQIVHLPVTDLQPAWSFLFSLLFWAWINRGSFQIIHAHNAAMGVISSIVGWLTGKKVVVKIPSLKYVQYLNGGSLSRELRRWILTRKTERFIAVSTEMVQALLKAGIAPEKLALISNGIELTAPCTTNPSALRKQVSGDSEGPVVLFVGRLVKEKGLDRLLRVWASLPGHERMLLLIVGDGPLREDLESQTKKLRLVPSVRFLGHQTDVSKLYCIADLFVLPSKTEGMSNSLLEAMAAGLPVVASNVGGNKDVIKDQQSGFLVDWEDTTLCAGMLLTLLSDTELRLRIGNAAKREVSAFAMGDVAERYHDLYQAVLQE
jgi:glycosyltransferase involved in cell wall biosynthesis